MAGTTNAYSRSTGTFVYGHWLNSSDEINVQDVASLLDAMYDAWPHPAFWLQLRCVNVWSNLRQDKPKEFRDNPQTAGLYDYTYNVISFHSPQFLSDKPGFMGHELGHMFDDVYLKRDAIGQKAWDLQALVSGTTDPELFAGSVSRVLLRRLQFRYELVPKGFEFFMDYVRQVRS